MNPKFKSENYMNLGGINSKFSPHLTSPIQFLDIKNYDFQTPGSLTQRWGSTQYMGQTFAGKILALSEYQKLDGTSMIIVGATGGMWYGATTGNFQGMSLGAIGVTQSLSFGFTGTAPQPSLFNALTIRTSGPTSAPYIEPFFGRTNGVWYQGATNQYIGAMIGSFGTFSLNIAPTSYSPNYSSIQYLVDHAFIANGNGFFKFNGTNFNTVGLPPPILATFSATLRPQSATTVGFGSSGAVVFAVSYVNNRGFESNLMPIASMVGPCSIQGLESSYQATFFAQTIAMTCGIFTPLSYGISAINVYAYGQRAVGMTVAQTLFTNYFGNYPDATIWNALFAKVNTIPASGSTITYFPLGTTAGNLAQNFEAIVNNSGQLVNPNSQQYITLGLTLGVKGDDPGAVIPGPTIGEMPIPWKYSDTYRTLSIQPFFPRYLAVYDNRLFCAGFSSAPSTVWYSDVQEPEGFLPENNFEVRTNDADYLTAMQAYQTRLYFFKKNSFHVLTGDNPNNFFLQEISNIYGCLNNRSVVIFENLMFFLDRKGVVEFTGANISMISTPIQPIFDRMNYNAALTEACAAHDKLRNQVLFAIPVDGSSTNNLTIVYDYIARAWTTHFGYNPSIFAEIQGYNTTKRLFCGDYSGRVNWFSASFLSDNGSGITLSFKTRYLHDMGDSVQKQFRRLFLNAENLGATLSNQINFYQDYGTSIVLATTLNLGAFQDRIDYGISAKSLAFEMISLNTTNSPLKIHGFTIESRMQRKV